MNTARQRVACIEIGGLSRPNGGSGHAPLKSAPLHTGKRFAYIEAKAGIERERAIVKRGLHQANASESPTLCAIQHGMHQLVARTKILRRRIHSDRANSSDDRALVHAIAADDSASALGYNAIKT